MAPKAKISHSDWLYANRDKLLSKENSLETPQPIQGDNKNIFWLNFADWARKNVEKLPDLFQGWFNDSSAWIFYVFPIVKDKRTKHRQNKIVFEHFTPEIGTRNVPFRNQPFRMYSEEKNAVYTGQGFEIDYHHMLTDEGWDEWDMKTANLASNLWGVMIYTDIRELLISPTVFNTPSALFPYQNRPDTVDELIRAEAQTFGILNKENLGIINVCRQAARILEGQGKTLKGFICSTGDMFYTKLMDQYQIIYDKAGGAATHNRLAGDDFTTIDAGLKVFTIPYMDSKDHNGLHAQILDHAVQTGSKVEFPDKSVAAGADTYYSGLRTIRWCSSTTNDLDTCRFDQFLGYCFEFHPILKATDCDDAMQVEGSETDGHDEGEEDPIFGGIGGGGRRGGGGGDGMGGGGAKRISKQGKINMDLLLKICGDATVPHHSRNPFSRANIKMSTVHDTDDRKYGPEHKLSALINSVRTSDYIKTSNQFHYYPVNVVGEMGPDKMKDEYLNHVCKTMARAVSGGLSLEDKFVLDEGIALARQLNTAVLPREFYLQALDKANVIYGKDLARNLGDKTCPEVNEFGGLDYPISYIIRKGTTFYPWGSGSICQFMTMEKLFMTRPGIAKWFDPYVVRTVQQFMPVYRKFVANMYDCSHKHIAFCEDMVPRHMLNAKKMNSQTRRLISAWFVLFFEFDDPLVLRTGLNQYTSETFMREGKGLVDLTTADVRLPFYSDKTMQESTEAFKEMIGQDLRRHFRYMDRHAVNRQVDRLLQTRKQTAPEDVAALDEAIVLILNSLAGTLKVNTDLIPALLTSYRIPAYRQLTALSLQGPEQRQYLQNLKMGKFMQALTEETLVTAVENAHGGVVLPFFISVNEQIVEVRLQVRDALSRTVDQALSKKMTMQELADEIINQKRKAVIDTRYPDDEDEDLEFDEEEYEEDEEDEELEQEKEERRVAKEAKQQEKTRRAKEKLREAQRVSEQKDEEERERRLQQRAQEEARRAEQQEEQNQISTRSRKKKQQVEQQQPKRKSPRLASRKTSVKYQESSAKRQQALNIAVNDQMHDQEWAAADIFLHRVAMTSSKLMKETLVASKKRQADAGKANVLTQRIAAVTNSRYEFVTTKMPVIAELASGTMSSSIFTALPFIDPNLYALRRSNLGCGQEEYNRQPSRVLGDLDPTQDEMAYGRDAEKIMREEIQVPPENMSHNTQYHDFIHHIMVSPPCSISKQTGAPTHLERRYEEASTRDTFMMAVIRLVLLTTISLQAMYKWSDNNIAIPFGGMIMRPFETQIMHSQIAMGSLQLGKNFFSGFDNTVGMDQFAQHFEIQAFFHHTPWVAEKNGYHVMPFTRGGAIVGGKGNKPVNSRRGARVLYGENLSMEAQRVKTHYLGDGELMGDYSNFHVLQCYNTAVEGNLRRHADIRGRYHEEDFTCRLENSDDFLEQDDIHYDGQFVINEVFGFSRQPRLMNPKNASFEQYLQLRAHNHLCSQTTQTYFNEMGVEVEMISSHLWKTDLPGMSQVTQSLSMVATRNQQAAARKLWF